MIIVSSSKAITISSRKQDYIIISYCRLIDNNMDLLVSNLGFAQVASKIFQNLDDKSLCQCRLVCQNWRRFIDNRKFKWKRVVHKQTSKLSIWLESNEEWKNIIGNLISNGSVDEIRRLNDVFQGFNASSLHHFGITPLHQAVYSGDISTVSFLLPYFQDKLQSDAEGTSLVHLAALKGRSELIKYFAELGINLGHVCNNRGETPMHFAALGGDLATFKVLSKYQEINTRASNGETPLHQACKSGHRLIIKYIVPRLNHKDLEAKDEDGLSILHYVASRGHLKIMEYLLPYFDEKSPTDTNGNTPIHFAVSSGHLDLANFLLDQSEDKNPINHNGETLLHLAAKKGYSSLFLNLVKKAKDKNPSDAFGQTPLHFAAECGHVSIVEILVDMLLESNPKDGKERTPLHYAAMHGHFEIVKLFIPVVSELNPKDGLGMTPIKYASMNGHFKIVHLIVRFLPPEVKANILDMV